MLEERRRIARDVHDFVGHGLAAVMLQVTSARHVLRRDPAAAEEALRSAEEVGRMSMRELRRTVALLRSDEEEGVLPPVPTANEIPALVDYARAGGLPVELRMRGDLAAIAPTVGLALYRIAQEALANAIRHGQASHVAIQLATEGDLLTLSVVDDGAGLPEPPLPKGPGLGIRIMAYRAAMIGAAFDIQRRPGGGTIVRCTWRFSDRRSEESLP
jgi:signal transduction histidine kinase